MAEQFQETYFLRRMACTRMARTRGAHRRRDLRRRRLAKGRTSELDELIGLIDQYEEWFGMTPLSLAVVTLDGTSETRLASLLRGALGRGRPLPHHVFERYSALACAIS
jgi:hypothetical protein